MSGPFECAVHGRFEIETGTLCPVCAEPMAKDGEPVWYADGAGWNGKISRTCMVSESGTRLIATHGDLTNNQAEYVAAIDAASHMPCSGILRLDSRLVIEQVRGTWKINDPVLEVAAKQLRFLTNYKGIVLSWVPREFNLAGHVLEGK